MRTERKPSVLVCVTGQYECDRLINFGFEKAVELGYELHVLNVRAPGDDFSALGDEIEHLYRTSSDLGGDMTLAVNAHAPSAAAHFAKQHGAKLIVTGMPDSRPNGFVVTLHELLPKHRIHMVDQNGESLLFSVDRTAQHFA